MSTPGIYNWENNTRGDTILSRTFTPTIDSAPVDLSNVQIDIEFRNQNKSVLKHISVGDGIQLSANNNSFTIEEFKLNNFSGTVLFDIQFKFAGDVVKTWVKGSFEIKNDETQK